MLPLSQLTFRPLNVDIEFKGITHSMPQKNAPDKFIITNASGKFKHGSLHAIMGPSGCGKSSLLNVLSGFNPIAKGKIAFNGEEFDVKDWGSVMSSMRSYILQDDFMVAELTVQEQMNYAVALKVPDGIDEKQRKKMIDSVLKKIGMEETRSRRLGALSGGQKKRISVASELINFPPVLFLDEPTTGLDSTSTYRLIDLLKSVAKVGCTVIATIHQPNSRVFAIFDTLTVLYTQGRIAYK